jgi:hypothetical protein
MILATRRPPDALGEVSLLDGGPRSAEALDNVLVLAIARSTLIQHRVRDRSLPLHASGRLLQWAARVRA